MGALKWLALVIALKLQEANALEIKAYLDVVLPIDLWRVGASADFPCFHPVAGAKFFDFHSIHFSRFLLPFWDRLFLAEASYAI